MPHPSSVVRGAAVASVLLVASALPATPALAQPGQAPQRAENLQVLPKDLSRDSVTQIMRGVALALGVRCDYCHVTEQVPPPAGAPAGTPARERFLFARDDKRTKQTARFMMRMADSLNRVVLAALPARHDPPVDVSCVTCHRGSPIPQTIDRVLAGTIERSGVDSAIARYRMLRENVVAGRYDFGEIPVTDLARSLSNGGKTSEALALLRMNQEYFPNSAEIDLALGDVHAKRGEKDEAIARYRAVLVKQPNDRRARQRLQELGAAPGA